MQKVLFASIGVICVLIWTFVGILIFTNDNRLPAKTASLRLSAVESLSVPEELRKPRLENENQVDKTNPKQGMPNTIQPLEKEAGENGLTIEDIKQITDSKQVPIDVLLSALNIK